MKRTESEYWDYRLSWASTAYFIGSVANASIKTILPISESMWGVLSAIVGMGILLVYAICFKELQKRSSKVFWKSVALFVFIYFISFILIFFRGEPLDQMIKGTAFLTFAWWIPVGVLVMSVKDKQILYEVWVKASYVISALAILMYFFYIPIEDSTGSFEYNMAFGFYIILPLIIQINEFLRNKRAWLLLLVLFEVFTVLVYANRGVLLSLIFFGVYKFAFESRSVIKKIVSSVILILMTIVLLSSIQSVAQSLVSILDVFGIQSRTIELLALGTISDTSGRDDIWKICFKMIEEKPIMGWGLGGEYYEIGKRFMSVSGSEVLATSFHPHNGLIQNFVCFGLLGGLISSILILIPLFNLNRIKNKYTRYLVIIFLSSSVIPRCISASGFFISPEVAVCLYLFYFRNTNNRLIRYENNDNTYTCS